MTGLYLARHGETEWSHTEQHTSTADPPLTDSDREETRALNDWLDPRDFGLVSASPRQRAQEITRLVGLYDSEAEEDLAEWFYDDCEGITSEEVQKTVSD